MNDFIITGRNQNHAIIRNLRETTDFGTGSYHTVFVRELWIKDGLGWEREYKINEFVTITDSMLEEMGKGLDEEGLNDVLTNFHPLFEQVMAAYAMVTGRHFLLDGRVRGDWGYVAEVVPNLMSDAIPRGGPDTDSDPDYIDIFYRRTWE